MNCHQWRDRYELSQDNDPGAQNQHRHQLQYQSNTTCDSDGYQFRHEWRNDGEGPFNRDCDQTQDRLRHHNHDSNVRCPGGP